MNWIDLIIIIVFASYVWEGYQRGFMRLMWELIGLVVAFFMAIKFYYPFANFLTNFFHLEVDFARPTAFLFLWAVTEITFFLIGKLIIFYIPVSYQQSKVNQVLGLIPAVLKAIIFVFVFVILFLMLPIANTFKDKLNQSFFGGKIIQATIKLEKGIEKVFLSEPLIIKKESIIDEQTDLGFKETKMEITEIDEDKMLGLINEERKNENLQPLKADPLIRNVARASSADKLVNGYFAHASLQGGTLYDRLLAANLEFTVAGENIALAPTVELAHVGLMNSPKHRQNILNPNFQRVGIGIMKTQDHGLMITQNFAD